MTDDQMFHARHGVAVEPARLPLPHDLAVRDAARQEANRDRLHWVLDHLPASRPGRPVEILDLGCGGGDLSLLLAERGDRVTGVDLSPSMVERSRRRREGLPADVAARLDFTVGDGQALDGVADGAFDAAAVDQLLDQVGDPVQVLCELHRTLRPGASLVLTVPYGVSEDILRIARAGEAVTGGGGAAARAGEAVARAGEAGARASEAVAGTGEAVTGAGEAVARVGEAVARAGEAGARAGEVQNGPGEPDEDADRRRVFYHGSLRHLVEPLFEIRELTVLRGHLVGVAVRRDEMRGTPGFALSRAETAFLQRERLLHGEIAELRDRCAELAGRAGALAAAGEDLLGHNAALRAEATRLGQRVTQLEGRLAEYREVIARLRRSRAWRLITAYRRLRYPSTRGIGGKRPIVITGSATTADTPRPALPARAESSTPTPAAPKK
ncbi:class I SAM-dependent methyltransferase [Sphaerisporangium fuscum]|uniref:class I SAM-dependent methyltransferase n=1 Tax=Sphaerisporangium fuscum TaxID=2835868 RepID=UPI001BDD5FDD|nr:class I SAM-dependent methyltransferase [Sphaerisporangium fuscum]